MKDRTKRIWKSVLGPEIFWAIVEWWCFLPRKWDRVQRRYLAPIPGLPIGLAVVPFFEVCDTDRKLYVAARNSLLGLGKTWVQMG
jgi:hypothetical protein